MRIAETVSERRGTGSALSSGNTHCEEMNFYATRIVCGNDENFLKSSQRRKVFGKAPFLGHNRLMSLSGL